MGRIRYSHLTASVVAAALLVTTPVAAQDGSMTSRRIKGYSLIGGGGQQLIVEDEFGDRVFNGITGIGTAHTLGSSCDDPSLGDPEARNDDGCFVDIVDGDPGLITRHGWFHRLCATDRTDPEITAPADIVAEQQTNRDGWTVLMNWLDVDDSADPRLIPIATDDVVPRPKVRVRAPGVVTDLSPKELQLGGRLMEHLGDITFPLGVTTVSLLAIDCGGNTAADSFTVQVVDTLPADLDFNVGVEAPDVHVVRIEAESPFGTVVDHAVPEIHEDICDANPVLTSDLCLVCPQVRYLDPDTGALVTIEECRCTLYNSDFEIDGEHLVSYTSTDFSGNVTHEEGADYDPNDQVLYVIEDTQPPTLSIVEQVKRIEQEEACGTVLGAERIPGAFFGDAATPRELLTLTRFDGHGVGCQRDARDEPPTPINASFCFPLGQTTTLYVVEDLSGNTTCAEAIIDVVDTIKPTQRLFGGLLPQWYSSPQSITYEFTDICDANLDVAAAPEDDPLTRDGDLYTAVYSSDNHWDVQFSAEDDSGNLTETPGQTFGIDRTAVSVTYEGIPQVGALGVVDPNNSTTFPAYFDGDVIDTLVSADDDPGRTGHYSGIQRLDMRVDPAGNNIPLLQPVPSWGPLEGTIPPTGPRQVVRVQCSNGDYCTGGLFHPDALRKGPHVLLVEATDVAGNGPEHIIQGQQGKYFYYFNVFNLQLALEQAAAIAQVLIDDDETPDEARELLEGVYALDEGERIPFLNSNNATGWFEMERQGVLDLVGFSPERKAGIGGHQHVNAYSVLAEWHRRDNVGAENPSPYWGRAPHRTIGNVLLFLADIAKKLSLAGQYVDTVGVLDNLTRGGIAELNLYLNFAFELVDPDNAARVADLQTARGYRNAAIQDHANGGYNQAMLELMNSLFYIENALFPIEEAHPNIRAGDQRLVLDATEDLAQSVLDQLVHYVNVTQYNNRDDVALLRFAANRPRTECVRALADAANPLHQFCIDRIPRFTATGERDLGGGILAILTTGNGDGLYLSEEAWLHHLIEFVDYNRQLDRLSGQHHVWTRFTSWEILHLTKFIFEFARDAACRQHLHGRANAVEPLCPNFAGHDHLHEARCRNSLALTAFNTREVDDARRIVVGSECLLRYSFDNIYNTYVDIDNVANTRECWNSETEEYESVACNDEGEECEPCPENTCLSQRFRCDRFPQLIYPAFPVCPPPDLLLASESVDGPDAAPEDELPDYYVCDGSFYCPDDLPPVPSHLAPGAGGSCDEGRFDDPA